jgi:hypothetical protein
LDRADTLLAQVDPAVRAQQAAGELLGRGDRLRGGEPAEDAVEVGRVGEAAGRIGDRRAAHDALVHRPHLPHRWLGGEAGRIRTGVLLLEAKARRPLRYSFAAPEHTRRHRQS